MLHVTVQAALGWKIYILGKDIVCVCVHSLFKKSAVLVISVAGTGAINSHLLLICICTKAVSSGGGWILFLSYEKNNKRRSLGYAYYGIRLKE